LTDLVEQNFDTKQTCVTPDRDMERLATKTLIMAIQKSDHRP